MDELDVLQEMKSIRQNPSLRIWGSALLITGAAILWWLGPGLASIVTVAGIVIAFTGTDTELRDDGIKLGFTKIKSDDVADVFEDTEGVIVLVTRDRHRYRMKRWHYLAADWPQVRKHIFGLIDSQNKPAHTTADNA